MPEQSNRLLLLVDRNTLNGFYADGVSNVNVNSLMVNQLVVRMGTIRDDNFKLSALADGEALWVNFKSPDATPIEKTMLLVSRPITKISTTAEVDYGVVQEEEQDGVEYFAYLPQDMLANAGTWTFSLAVKHVAQVTDDGEYIFDYIKTSSTTTPYNLIVNPSNATIGAGEIVTNETIQAIWTSIMAGAVVKVNSQSGVVETYKNTYSAGEYYKGDIVLFNNSLWLCVKNIPAEEEEPRVTPAPNDPYGVTYWKQFGITAKATTTADGLMSKEDKAALDNHIASRQNPHNVTKAQVGLSNVDNTADADKPVSDATQDAIDDLSETLQGEIDDITEVIPSSASSTNLLISENDLDDALSPIQAVIPAQATSSNQLADKNFVNSTVQTATANFQGNWNDWASVPINADEYPNGTPTSNDYLVVADASGYVDPFKVLSGTWRFKYSGTWATDGRNGWYPEYQVNETPLTAAQLAALNSGATADLIAQISRNEDNISTIDGNVSTLASDLADDEQAIQEIRNDLDDKVDKVTGKGLSSNDYTNADKTKLDGIEAGAEVNTVDSVNGKTGAVTLTATDVGAASTADLNNLSYDVAGKIDVAAKGVAGGVATLGADGKVPTSQLPNGGGTPDGKVDKITATAATGDLIYMALCDGTQGSVKATYTPHGDGVVMRDNGNIYVPTTQTDPNHATSLEQVENLIDGATSPIEALIPSQASTSNQLADKAFVNSTVQTATAVYQGSWEDWASVPSSVDDYPNGTPTNNDYIVVQDASDYTGDTITGTWRFKYSGVWATNGKNGWRKEYQVNEEPLTAAQLAALNSGVTTSTVSQVATNTTDIGYLINTRLPSIDNAISTNASDISNINTALDNKVDKDGNKQLSDVNFTTSLSDKLTNCREISMPPAQSAGAGTHKFNKSLGYWSGTSVVTARVTNLNSYLLFFPGVYGFQVPSGTTTANGIPFSPTTTEYATLISLPSHSSWSTSLAKDTTQLYFSGTTGRVFKRQVTNTSGTTYSYGAWKELNDFLLKASTSSQDNGLLVPDLTATQINDLVTHCKNGQVVAIESADGFKFYVVNNYNSLSATQNSLTIVDGTDAVINYNSNNGTAIRTVRRLEPYPVGSIYITIDYSFDPSNYFGGTWARLGAGRTLWTSTTAGQGGNTIAAGLPNITGQFTTGAYATGTMSGAFEDAGTTAKGASGTDGRKNATFDASRSSSIYGNSTTVQPPAIVVYMWKRTA